MLRPLIPELPILRKELVGLLRTRRAFWFLAIPVLSGGLGASLSDLRVATQPLSALGAALRGDQDIALLCFFLLHAAMTLAIWHVARLEIEVLRGRDG